MGEAVATKTPQTVTPKGGLIAAGLAAVLALTALFVQPWEGRKYTPYRDIVGVLTVCDGHTGPDIEQRKYTDAECDAFLKKDLEIAHKAIERCITAPLKQHEEAALTSAVFNIGPRVVCGSTLQRKANGGQPFCAELKKWVYAGGEVIRGLVRRREAEYQMCIGN